MDPSTGAVAAETAVPRWGPPETTTVLRWVLRAILVGFLAWLVKRRPDQGDDDEEDDEEEDEGQDVADQGRDARRTDMATKPRAGRGAANARLPNQRARDPYAPAARDLRQRRPMGTAGETFDFDAIINKMSKPKDLWETHKSGAPIVVRKPAQDAASTPAQQSKDPARRPQVNMMQGHTRPISCIALNRDGNLLFTCSKDKRVCVWSFPEGECLGGYEGHNGAVWACSVTEDSRWLVTCGADNCIIVWEARTSREAARKELPGVVKYVEWASRGGAGGPADGSGGVFVSAHNRFAKEPAALTVWKFDGTAIEQVIRISQLPTPATQVRWGKGDETLISSHENGEIVFWSAQSGEEIRRWKAHDKQVSKFDLTTDREVLATVSHDNRVKVWDCGEGCEGKLLFSKETDRPLNGVALGPLTRADVVGPVAQRPSNCICIAAGGQDIRDVAGTCSNEDIFESFCLMLGEDEIPGELKVDGMALKGHFGPVHTLAFTADGSAIASGSEDGCARLHVFPSADAKAEA
eukprot:gnl/TRDRNA2_/TRDRNA2_72768_c1_seq1.p1 gnl/TRDRNA2_/TRDRNA2_72768_c1~~gnl/TRDRNA2_/TRDRNA2_72768_c1_seq1.p1  ORF type:complete len:523 (+),score=95.14 gnl/TRDRNA2_/TRDRNA2_72768_c1_seq1:84-1652(+)